MAGLDPAIQGNIQACLDGPLEGGHDEERARMSLVTDRILGAMDKGRRHRNKGVYE
jgi:hypothetical protein